SGELEFDEFLALTSRFLVEEDAEAMQEELREAFRMYDKEGNGYINVADLREILRALDDKLTEDELDEMIAEIDTDGSGTVDFDGVYFLLMILDNFKCTGVLSNKITIIFKQLSVIDLVKFLLLLSNPYRIDEKLFTLSLCPVK
ncbi:Troponin C, partial [Araneus ventricosus]